MTEELNDSPISSLKKGEELEGKIVKINKEKGYGFIISSARRFTRFFFHWTGLETTTMNFAEVKSGAKVKFIEAFGDRGPRAIQIRILENGTKEDAPISDDNCPF